MLRLINKAQKLAAKVGIKNITQPGIIKEIIIADLLKHRLIYSKRDSDACDRFNPSIKYEYLSCYEGGSGQIDRMFARPQNKREKSLERILRNKYIYLAVFYKEEPLRVKTVYEIDPELAAKEAERQLDRSKNDISHVAFSENWAAKNGKLVYTG